MNAQLARSYAACRELTRRHGKSFYLASFTLPKPQRLALYALYAFCRNADDLVDEGAARSPETIRFALDGMRSRLLGLYAGDRPAEGLYLALGDAIARYRIPPTPFLELLDGVAMDLERRRYRTYAELEVYCYKVASVVGLMLCHVFGNADERAQHYAAAMGKAMQLTNILRDVGEDYRMGRVYLPQEELEAFGYGEADLARQVVDERFVALMTFQIERARQLYAYAFDGLQRLDNPRSWLTARLMGRLYAGILEAIELGGYDVHARRATVATPRRLRLLAACVLETYRPRRTAPPAGRVVQP